MVINVCRAELTDCGARFVQLGQHSVILLDFGHDPLDVAVVMATAAGRSATVDARQFRHGRRRNHRLRKALAQVVI